MSIVVNITMILPLPLGENGHRVWQVGITFASEHNLRYEMKNNEFGLHTKKQTASNLGIEYLNVASPLSVCVSRVRNLRRTKFAQTLCITCRYVSVSLSLEFLQKVISDFTF